MGGSGSDDDSPDKSEDRYRSVFTDEDEEYSNLYRKAKNARNKKLAKKREDDDTRDDEANDYLTENKDEKEFFHYLAVPVLEKGTKSNLNEDYFVEDRSNKHYLGFKDEDSDEFVSPGHEAINYKKSYLSMSNLGASVVQDKVEDSSSDEEEAKESTKKKMTLERMTLLIDSDMQKNTIGETLFNSTKLKGLQK